MSCTVINEEVVRKKKIEFSKFLCKTKLCCLGTLVNILQANLKLYQLNYFKFLNQRNNILSLLYCELLEAGLFFFDVFLRHQEVRSFLILAFIFIVFRVCRNYMIEALLHSSHRSYKGS